MIDCCVPRAFWISGSRRRREEVHTVDPPLRGGELAQPRPCVRAGDGAEGDRVAQLRALVRGDDRHAVDPLPELARVDLDDARRSGRSRRSSSRASCFPTAPAARGEAVRLGRRDLELEPAQQDRDERRHRVVYSGAEGQRSSGWRSSASAIERM